MAEERETLDQLFTLLDRLPFVGSVRKDAGTLRHVLYERRAARLLAIGVAKSGKSSLANALLRKPALPVDAPEEDRIHEGDWVRVDASGARVDWLELSLRGRPAESVASLRRACAEMHPDVALLVLTPENVDVIDGILSEVKAMYESLDASQRKPPLLVALTHAPSLRKRSSDLLDTTLTTIRRALTSRGMTAAAVLGVGTQMADDLDEAPARADLAEAVLAALPEPARLEAARAMPDAVRGRRRLANTVVHSAAALAMTIGLAPIPLSDIFLIGPLQAVMVSAVAHLGGRTWNRNLVVEWIASLGVVGSAAIGFRWAAQQLAKLVPGAGTLVSAGVAGAGTAALGQSAIAYFIEGVGTRRLPPPAAPS